MRLKKGRKALATGHFGTREIKEYDRRALELKLCPYTPECNRRCINDEDCKIRRFYEKYPDYKSLMVKR